MIVYQVVQTEKIGYNTLCEKIFARKETAEAHIEGAVESDKFHGKEEFYSYSIKITEVTEW